jgi:hypothetical protein
MANNSFIKAYKWASSFNKEGKKNVILTARERGETSRTSTVPVFIEVTMFLYKSYTGELHISVSSHSCKSKTFGCR